MLKYATQLGKVVMAALILVMPGMSVAATPSPHFVIFGDSLSDSGNLFVVNNVNFIDGANNVPPEYLFSPGLNPDAAYARGGHHLSNGETWIEIVTRDAGHAVNGNPAFASDNPLATNYAVAGARARNRTEQGAIDLGDEVTAFLSDFGAGKAPSDALYVIAIGANDIGDISAGGDPAIAQAALAAIGDNIGALYGNGARHFLVLGVPDMGLLPIAQGNAAAASAGSAQFNLALQYLVLAPLAALPGMDIRYFDLYGALDDMVTNHESYGFTVVDAPCVTPNEAPFFCQAPDTYVFWDGIHPTRAAHAVLAGKVETFLAQ